VKAVRSPASQRPPTTPARFVTILGRRSNTSAWPSIEAELNRQRIYYISNIDEIVGGRTSLSEAEILESVRNTRCLGLIVLTSDQYFRYLDEQAAAEKEVILDYIPRRPEFNFNRTHFESGQAQIFIQELRLWLQAPTGTASPLDSHPDILDILKVSFGQSVEDRYGLVCHPSEGIQYNLFQYEDTILGSQIFVLYLHQGITVSRTAAHFRRNFLLTVRDRSLLILIDPKSVSNRTSWMRTIKSNIECTNALFLDDFLQKRFTLNIPASPHRSEKTIVTPRLKKVEAPTLVEQPFKYLFDSVEPDSSTKPIVMIRGQGGVGKTTLCRYLAHEMAQSGSGDLFVLSAAEVVQALAEAPELGPAFTLFNLLRAMYAARVGAVGEQEFAWIFDTGRASFVVDGIDEIVPRLGNADAVKTFFDSVLKYSNYLKRGRVILTCRNTNFLGEQLTQTSLEELELLPFESPQVEDYLDRRFKRMEGLRQRAAKFLGDVAITATGTTLPFVLRIVCDSVEDGRDVAALGGPLSQSDILDANKRLDYVILKVCEREEAKYDYYRFYGIHNPIDIQVEFFMQLALAFHGSCERGLLNTFFRGYAPEMDNATLGSMCDHPLLTSPHAISFADEVLKEYFLALSYSRVVSGHKSVAIDQLIEIPDKSQLQSPFLADVADRLGDLSDYALMFLEDLVSRAQREYLDAGKKDEYFRNASAFLNVALQLLTRDGHVANGRAIEAIRNLFGGAQRLGAKLAEVAIHNVPASAGLRLDFSGVEFEDASVMNYEEFYKCGFDAGTRFVRSRIRTGMTKVMKTKANASNFINCDLDPVFAQSIAMNAERSAFRLEDATRQLRNFLRVFRINGTFRNPRKIEIMQANYRSTTPLSFRDVLAICERHELVERQGGSEVRVDPRQIAVVESFVDERIYRGEIESAIKDIFEAIS
jgi:hypothetical protein